MLTSRIFPWYFFLVVLYGLPLVVFGTYWKNGWRIGRKQKCLFAKPKLKHLKCITQFYSFIIEQYLIMKLISTMDVDTELNIFFAGCHNKVDQHNKLNGLHMSVWNNLERSEMKEFEDSDLLLLPSPNEDNLVITEFPDDADNLRLL